MDKKMKVLFFTGVISGHFIEWYDYSVWGFLAADIAKTFFAGQPPLIGLLSSFALFAVSFFIRPLGGLFFGPLADRLGRKKTLVVIISIMSVATCLPAVLPGSAQTGVVAPLLLLLARCLQGFSAGGEVGTVISYVTEMSGNKKVSFTTSWLMVTAVLGVMAGAMLVNLLNGFLGAEKMASWGWRLPFLVALPAGMISLYIRRKLDESPCYLQLSNRADVARAPLKEVFKWKSSLLYIALMTPLNCSMFYLVLIYVPTWLSAFLKLAPAETFHFSMLSDAVAIFSMLIGAIITDRFGRLNFLIGSGGVATLIMGAFFLPAVRENTHCLQVTLMLLSMAFGLFTSSVYALMSELLPARVRATGLALAYNLPVAVFGGCTPLIATWLVQITGSLSAPGGFFLLSGVISTAGLCTLKLRRTALIPAVSDLDDPYRGSLPGTRHG